MQPLFETCSAILHARWSEPVHDGFRLLWISSVTRWTQVIWEFRAVGTSDFRECIPEFAWSPFPIIEKTGRELAENRDSILWFSFSIHVNWILMDRDSRPIQLSREDRSRFKITIHSNRENQSRFKTMIHSNLGKWIVILNRYSFKSDKWLAIQIPIHRN